VKPLPIVSEGTAGETNRGTQQWEESIQCQKQEKTKKKKKNVIHSPLRPAKIINKSEVTLRPSL
jgi:hypothetical protein